MWLYWHSVASFSRTAPDELWVAFGVGQSFQFIAIHQIVATMTLVKCRLSLSFTLSLGVTLSAFAS